MFIAWTTVAKREDAELLAVEVVARNLAVCVQIEGPITSHYRWQGKDERADEYRLVFKCLAPLAAGPGSPRHGVSSLRRTRMDRLRSRVRRRKILVMGKGEL